MSRYIDATDIAKQIADFKRVVNSPNSDYMTGYLCALSVTEGMIANVMIASTDAVVEIPEGGIGNLSDGYHTFNELYHHRAILFSVICNSMPEKAWKSKLHDTGDMFDGMFIVGIETPEGQATYHYDIVPYWDMFKVKELEKAPKWDGHTPQEAIERIAKISADMIEVVRCKDCEYWENGYGYCKRAGLDCYGNSSFYKNSFCSNGKRREE
jgi:hypothetical protein